MKAWRGLLVALSVAGSFSFACAQTPPPLLGSIEAPYASLQISVKLAGVAWPSGIASYGPVGTPLVLSGSDLGGDGTVQFVPYKNGSVDTSVSPVQATVTLWTPNMLILTVPSGAMSGLVTVTVEGQTSNGLPFLVTPGTYAGSCPASPSNTQLQITTTSLHDGAVSQSYSATLSATGGSGSYTWSVSSGSLPAGLSLSTSGIISGTPTSTSGSNPSPITFRVNDTSSPPLADEAEMTLAVESQTMVSGSYDVYGYVVGYDGVGNVTSFQDGTYSSSPPHANGLPAGPGIMGTWSMIAGSDGSNGNGYDTLNRLSATSVTWPDGRQQALCWDFDSFGNRQNQWVVSGPSGFTSTSGNACQIASGATHVSSQAAQYNVHNQISDVLHIYDSDGDLIVDGTTGNQYLYDGEGQVCAVLNGSVPGMALVTGYLYDADGSRVAKGTIPGVTSLYTITNGVPQPNISCDPTSWTSFQFTENYVLGPAGEELTMLNGNNNWQRTNIYVGGKLIGTYDLDNNQSGQPIPALHFHLEDALGTRRMQISGMPADLGCPEMDFQSLPYGDQLFPYPDSNGCPPSDDATPLHFTAKERDSESGNDYFEARYYSSTMGRFLSPDWSAQEEPIPYANLDDPQSLNLYSYVRNNPLSRTDPDGHCGPTDPYGCYEILQVVGNVLFGGLQQFKRDTEATMAERDGLGPLKVAAQGYVLSTTLAMGADVPPEQLGVRTDVAAGEEGSLAAGAAAEAEGAAANPSEAYNRRAHYGDTPTAADKKAVGGESVDHDPPLVKRYYEGDATKGEKPGFQQTPAERKASANDRTRMRPSTRAAQRSQGGQMSNYSKQQKKKYGLDQ